MSVLVMSTRSTMLKRARMVSLVRARGGRARRGIHSYVRGVNPTCACVSCYLYYVVGC